MNWVSNTGWDSTRRKLGGATETARLEDGRGEGEGGGRGDSLGARTEHRGRKRPEGPDTTLRRDVRGRLQDESWLLKECRGRSECVVLPEWKKEGGGVMESVAQV